MLIPPEYYKPKSKQLRRLSTCWRLVVVKTDTLFLSSGCLRKSRVTRNKGEGTKKIPTSQN